MSLAAALIWSKIKTWMWETFMAPPESELVRAALKDHDCSPTDLEFAITYLRHYGYLQDLTPDVARQLIKSSARWFQEVQGITPDGVVGPETLGVMLEPRCGLPDLMIFEQVRWKKNNLGLFVESYVPVLSRSDQDDLIKLACDDWSQYADVSFYRVASKREADIYVQALPLDGPGRVLAQAQLPPGDDGPLFLQMDSREAVWVRALEGRPGEILFGPVFKHELGHNLGLGHSVSTGSRNVPPSAPVMHPRYSSGVVMLQRDDDIERIIAAYNPAKVPAPTPPVPPPSPQPPTGGKTMTKEQLKTWLVNMAKLLTSIAAWMIGPLGWARPYLANAAAFLTVLAENEFLLDLIVLMLGRGMLTLPANLEAPSEAQIASLTTDAPQ